MLLGEYSVLLGGEALVQAIRRRAVVSVHRADEPRIQLIAFASESRTSSEARSTDHSEAEEPVIIDLGQPLEDSLCSALGEAGKTSCSAAHTGSRGSGFILREDLEQLFDDEGIPLGLGASAARTVALGCCLDHLGSELEGEPDFFNGTRADPTNLHPHLHAAHSRLQGGLGSGADVAAALFGGTCRITPSTGVEGGMIETRLDVPFEQVVEDTPGVTRIPWPDGLVFAVFRHARRTPTPDGIRAFAHTHAHNPSARSIATDLGQATTAALDAFTHLNLGEFAYVVAEVGRLLQRLSCERMSQLTSAGHRDLVSISDRFGAVAKSCGAGADLTIVFSDEAERLETIKRAAIARGHVSLELEIDPHGVRID